MKEHIDEMTKVLVDYTKKNRIMASHVILADYAEQLYNAGYRKQSEPISCGHEKGGEWVQLPCKVGDILYVISQMKDKRFLPFINEYEATSIEVGKKKCLVYHQLDGYIKVFKQDDFGKTVFLTKEEAERAVTDNNFGVK